MKFTLKLLALPLSLLLMSANSMDYLGFILANLAGDDASSEQVSEETSNTTSQNNDVVVKQPETTEINIEVIKPTFKDAENYYFGINGCQKDYVKCLEILKQIDVPTNKRDLGDYNYWMKVCLNHAEKIEAEVKRIKVEQELVQQQEQNALQDSFNKKTDVLNEEIENLKKAKNDVLDQLSELGSDEVQARTDLTEAIGALEGEIKKAELEMARLVGLDKDIIELEKQLVEAKKFLQDKEDKDLYRIKEEKLVVALEHKIKAKKLEKFDIAQKPSFFANHKGKILLGTALVGAAVAYKYGAFDKDGYVRNNKVADYISEKKDTVTNYIAEKKDAATNYIVETNAYKKTADFSKNAYNKVSELGSKGYAYVAGLFGFGAATQVGETQFVGDVFPTDEEILVETYGKPLFEETTLESTFPMINETEEVFNGSNLYEEVDFNLDDEVNDLFNTDESTLMNNGETALESNLYKEVDYNLDDAVEDLFNTDESTLMNNGVTEVENDIVNSVKEGSMKTEDLGDIDYSELNLSGSEKNVLNYISKNPTKAVETKDVIKLYDNYLKKN